MPRTYATTNENLPSIVKGLDVKPEDYILAVGGSGDQAFALLEYAERVLAVDIETRQITCMQKQAKSLEIGDYETFLRRRLRRYSGSSDTLFRSEQTSGTKYFDRERLDTIRKKLPSLEIRKADVLGVCKNESGFNKVYLSNALNGHRDELGPRLKIVSGSIPMDGLVYASNGIIINEALDRTGLVMDKFLTSLTEDHRWDPIVLRKIREPEIELEPFSPSQLRLFNI